MKISIKHIIVPLFTGCITLFTSCSDFLTEESSTALSEKKIYSNLQYAELNLESIYTQWRNNCFKDEHVWMFLIATDEIQSGAYQALKSGAQRAAMETFDANLNSQHERITNEWNNRWPCVTSAAKIIHALNNNGLQTNKEQAKIYGEASFLRGCVDYQLAMYWGRIPTIDMGKTEQLGYGRQSLKDTWQFIINDFQEAAKYCSETQKPGRATRWAALTMLGKALMSAPEETGLRDFAKAQECFDKIIKSGKFRLNEDFADLWDYNKQNTPESIFEFQFKNASPDNNQIQFQIGSRAAQSKFTDACYFAGYDHAVPTKYAYSTKADGGVWEDGDLRMAESIRTDFTWFNGETPTLQGLEWEGLGNDYDELLPHIKKYEDFRTDSHSGLGINNMWHSGKNIPWLRYADVLLLNAECLNELGRTTEAINLINSTIRTRAWGGSLPADKQWTAMSKEEFRTQIMDERMRELFGEQWRRIDLVRTGNFEKLVKLRNEWSKRFATIHSYNTILPIPLTEIQQNPDMKEADQNKGYK